MKTTTGNRLQEYAAMHGLSQAKMRDKLKFAKSTMSNYWNDIRSPKQNILTYMCNVLNINEAWLMGYDVDMECPSTPTNIISPKLPDYTKLLNILNRNSHNSDFLSRLCDQAELLELKYGSFKN